MDLILWVIAILGGLALMMEFIIWVFVILIVVFVVSAVVAGIVDGIKKMK